MEHVTEGGARAVQDWAVERNESGEEEGTCDMGTPVIYFQPVGVIVWVVNERLHWNDVPYLTDTYSAPRRQLPRVGSVGAIAAKKVIVYWHTVSLLTLTRALQMVC